MVQSSSSPTSARARRTIAAASRSSRPSAGSGASVTRSTRSASRCTPSRSSSAHARGRQPRTAAADARPSRGDHRPEHVLPAAKRFGLIGGIDIWVRRAGRGPRGSRQAGQLQSLQRFTQATELIARILALLTASGADPGRVVYKIAGSGPGGRAHRGRGIRRTCCAEHRVRDRARRLQDRLQRVTSLERVPARYIEVDIKSSITCVTAAKPLRRQGDRQPRAGFGKVAVTGGVEDEATLELLAEYRSTRRGRSIGGRRRCRRCSAAMASARDRGRLTLAVVAAMRSADRPCPHAATPV